VFVCYGILTAIGAPTVYDKLLPVPLLNLSVRWIDRVASWSFLGALERWGASLQPGRVNQIAMTGWSALFVVLLSAGYVQGQQEGATVQFWQQACLEGKTGAQRGLLAVLKSSANDGNASAMNELGMLYLEGKFVEPDFDNAVRYFARASKMGSLAGSANVVGMFLKSDAAPTSPILEGALDQIEEACRDGADGPLYYLLGRAYESGRGRPADPARAFELYRKGCSFKNEDACRAVARIASAQRSGQ
jgi:hypothetical protein